MFALLSSVIIKNKHLKHPIKFILCNTATCRAVARNEDYGSSSVKIVSISQGRITEYTCSTQQRPELYTMFWLLD